MSNPPKLTLTALADAVAGVFGSGIRRSDQGGYGSFEPASMI